MTLVEAVRQFNRKERTWLVQTALGDRALTLDKDFQRRLEEQVGRQDPNFRFGEDVWWGLDYHLDWLLGAIRLYRNGYEAANAPTAYSNKLISGTQQDVDMLVVSDSTLILIEAKGVGGWEPSLGEKIIQLKKLHDFIQQEQNSKKISVHLVLCHSQFGSVPTIPDKELWLPADGSLLHVPLAIPVLDDPMLRVERCDFKGERSKSGGYWHVVRDGRASKLAGQSRPPRRRRPEGGSD